MFRKRRVRRKKVSRKKKSFQRKKVSAKETDPKKENIPEAAAPETEKSSEQQEEKEEVSKLQEIAQGFDIDFYIIIGGEKVKLQNNGITGIATWKDGRTTYHGISVDDSYRCMKNLDSQEEMMGRIQMHIISLYLLTEEKRE